MFQIETLRIDQFSFGLQLLRTSYLSILKNCIDLSFNGPDDFRGSDGLANRFDSFLHCLCRPDFLGYCRNAFPDVFRAFPDGLRWHLKSCSDRFGSPSNGV